jgi:hypothetical protein
LLYPAGDLDALAEACERLLTNPSLRATLGRSAAKLVRTQQPGIKTPNESPNWPGNSSRAGAHRRGEASHEDGLPHRLRVKVFPKISETFIASELAELHRRGVELRILSLQPPVKHCATISSAAWVSTRSFAIDR